MPREHDTFHMPRRVQEMHADVFYGGRKKKELHNFMYGTFLGIGLSILVDAIIEIIANSIELKKGIYLTNQFNSSLFNFTSQEQAMIVVENSYLILHYIYLGLLLLIGLMFLYFALLGHATTNSDLVDNRWSYRYKIKKGMSQEKLANIVEKIIKAKIKSKGKINKWLRTKQIVYSEGIDVVEYHFWKRWLFENANRFKIRKEYLIALYSTSQHGENFGKFIREEMVPSLQRSRYIRII